MLINQLIKLLIQLSQFFENLSKNIMFNKIFALQEKPHAIIAKLTSLSFFESFLKDYMKAIVCDKNPPCNSCQ